MSSNTAGEAGSLNLDSILVGIDESTLVTHPPEPTFEWMLRITHSKHPRPEEFKGAVLALCELYTSDLFVVREAGGSPNEHLHLLLKFNKTKKAFEKAMTVLTTKWGAKGNRFTAGKKVHDDTILDYLCKGAGSGKLPDVLKYGSVARAATSAAHGRYWARHATLKRKATGLDEIQDSCVKKLKTGASLNDIIDVVSAEVVGRRIWKPAFMGLLVGVRSLVNREEAEGFWVNVARNEMMRQ